MTKNTSITFGKHFFDEFVASQVNTGRYSSASEIVRAGLRLLEKSETITAILRRTLKEGEQSGVAEYGFDSFISELDTEN